jgi:predicted metal-dependent enzyme (double-stranded beta helix superfamily)
MTSNELARWATSIEDIISRSHASTHPGLVELCDALRQSSASQSLQIALVAKAEEARSSYRRWLVAEGSKFSAILIGWPPGFTTPVHDHDGLWGIELVLCGTLHVEEFELDRSGHRRMPALDLAPNTAAIFDNPKYAHACSNSSPTVPALSLHVYGGSLSAYTAYPKPELGFTEKSVRVQTTTEAL